MHIKDDIVMQSQIDASRKTFDADNYDTPTEMLLALNLRRFIKRVGKENNGQTRIYEARKDFSFVNVDDPFDVMIPEGTKVVFDRQRGRFIKGY